MKGLVIKSTGSWYVVLTENGQTYQARLRGKFKLKDNKVSNPIAVGDRVTIDLEGEEEGSAVIREIEPRQNYIIRKSTHKSAYSHILAANLDQALLVVTLVSPRTSFGFIDRFLVTADAYEIPAVLIFNKADLFDEDLAEYQPQVSRMYEQIGYRCFTCSAVTGQGLAEVRQLLDDKVTLVSGHSGVGKSTLLNALVPGLTLRTAEISDYSDKGKHTTTFAEMFEVKPGTYLIDTPGIKELGVVEMPKEEVSHYFPEMRERLNQCRFNNCLHVNEPGCVVREAVDRGKISLTRYQSYLSILADEDQYR